ncbi:unnamed protein product [Haemonchus placei]|uniref:MADF domain-containing protein n=1 Tax=Haemonchus placei TaxID=6290 RepID=A0A0N4WP26_HAEPC|nr:unnamed protein product [Haemonchus placei]
MLLSDIKKEEDDDVIDITQLLPSDDTNDSLFPSQPASPAPGPIPFRAKKSLQRRRQFPDKFPYSNDDDGSTFDDGPTFRAGRSSQRPPIMLNFRSKPRNNQTPGTVIGDNFLSDPCDEPHVCDPVDCLKDKVERLVYNKWREMQQNPRYADSACREVWKEMLDAFDDESLGDVEEREKMRAIYESSGYDNRRITIARNIGRLRRMMYKEALEQEEEGDDSLAGDDETSNPALETDKELAEELVFDPALGEENNTEESPRSPSSSYIEKLVKTEKSDR